MRGDEAREQCPEIQLTRVPVVRGKADLTRYRDAGDEVLASISRFSSCVKRASVDQAYLDVTDDVIRSLKILGDAQIIPDQLANTYVEGYE